jgi:hypothetical protein
MAAARSYARLQSGKSLYLAINASKVPPVPKQQPAFSPADLINLRAARNAEGEFPQLPFVLCKPPLSSPLLDVLSNPFLTRNKDNQYCLDSKVVGNWKALEQTLVQCATVLYRYAKSRGVQFPAGFDITRKDFLPCAFNYGSTFRVKDESRLAIKLSLYAFQLLAASISFVIANSSSPNDIASHPGWAIYLDVAGIDPVVINRLKSSPLCDPSAERFGAFVPRGTDYSWIRFIPVMERFNCPVFIHWDHDGWWDMSIYKELQPYRPSLQANSTSSSTSSRNNQSRGAQVPPPRRPPTNPRFSSSSSWGSISSETSVSSWGNPPSTPSTWGEPSSGASSSWGEGASSWWGEGSSSWWGEGASSWWGEGASSSWGEGALSSWSDGASSWGNASWGNDASSSWGNPSASSSWGAPSSTADWSLPTGKPPTFSLAVIISQHRSP